jgi:NAD(P)-dependent dehydrogenase (short-subunit alcohol dehydrogenase family)
MEFDERIAVVTGGSKGIGRAISLAFCQKGALVIAVPINEEQRNYAERPSR